MPIYSRQNNRKYKTAILISLAITLCFSAVALSSEQPNNRGNVPQKQDLGVMQEQARMYRQQGFELQNLGNLEGAKAFYQKAIETDPAYAVAYNDLGVLYESEGLIDQAELSYLKAINVDPNLVGAYTNLALVYENKRKLDKAVVYWQKRVDLGAPDDPWTEKAKQRVLDIQLVNSSSPSPLKEQEVLNLMQQVLDDKYLIKKDNVYLAREHFNKAKLSYEKQDELTALKEAIDAQGLDPSNKEIEQFIEKVQKRLLTR